MYEGDRFNEREKRHAIYQSDSTTLSPRLTNFSRQLFEGKKPERKGEVVIY